uniref:Uncharacterized protein n=1 Tax=Pipistrellus kuhlii TaxID=59472 RepID=A0A7J7WD85_PIPKU|nr:hypothetical protein mPipKuh1_008045 [Pipistrellus kuhlii]
MSGLQDAQRCPASQRQEEGSEGGLRSLQSFPRQASEVGTASLSIGSTFSQWSDGAGMSSIAGGEQAGAGHPGVRHPVMQPHALRGSHRGEAGGPLPLESWSPRMLLGRQPTSSPRILALGLVGSESLILSVPHLEGSELGRLEPRKHQPLDTKAGDCFILASLVQSV